MFAPRVQGKRPMRTQATSITGQTTMVGGLGATREKGPDAQRERSVPGPPRNHQRTVTKIHFPRELPKSGAIPMRWGGGKQHTPRTEKETKEKKEKKRRKKTGRMAARRTRRHKLPTQGPRQTQQGPEEELGNRGGHGAESRGGKGTRLHTHAPTTTSPAPCTFCAPPAALPVATWTLATPLGPTSLYSKHHLRPMHKEQGQGEDPGVRGGARNRHRPNGMGRGGECEVAVPGRWGEGPPTPAAGGNLPPTQPTSNKSKLHRRDAGAGGTAYRRAVRRWQWLLGGQ